MMIMISYFTIGKCTKHAGCNYRHVEKNVNCLSSTKYNNCMDWQKNETV